ncbi:hypothetical protein C8R46DRAFT_1128090, partial [Mycena filopes]
MGGSGGQTDSSYGSGGRTGDLGSGGMQREGEFGSSGGNRNEFGAAKPSMGDKVKGGAEKLVGKMTGNPNMQERGQERKMGEFEQRSNEY